MNYSSFIDHTALKPDTTRSEILSLCSEAKVNNFASVCVNPTHVKTCSDFLRGTDVKVCTVIGFPLGANTTTIKINETIDAIKNGANEIDMVINIGNLKDRQYDLVTEEISQIKRACGDNVILKVIVETCLLTTEEKISICKCVTDAKADYIKTSTGFNTGGAILEDIVLFKKNIGSKVKIKASGGIKSFQEMEKMIQAGASRIGTSKGVELLNNKKEPHANNRHY